VEIDPAGRGIGGADVGYRETPAPRTSAASSSLASPGSSRATITVSMPPCLSSIQIRTGQKHVPLLEPHPFRAVSECARMAPSASVTAGTGPNRTPQTFSACRRVSGAASQRPDHLRQDRNRNLGWALRADIERPIGAAIRPISASRKTPPPSAARSVGRGSCAIPTRPHKTILPSDRRNQRPVIDLRIMRDRNQRGEGVDRPVAQSASSGQSATSSTPAKRSGRGKGRARIDHTHIKARSSWPSERALAKYAPHR
jgi:hypothetical protein